MSQHVGPITFAHEVAREQLTTHGEVITFRPDERTVGRTWWRARRNGKKRGDVLVEKLRVVDPRNPFDLTPAQPKSGFDTVPAWMEAIERFHGSLPAIGVLYRVTEVSELG